VINIEDFLKVDLRVGRIISVEEHPKARKPMYKLRVYLGPEIGERKIVAGIRGSYSKEELIDKYVICIVNLEPKKIAGAESNGMLLAAEDSQKIALLAPDKRLSPGSKIH
jgi:methionyl-tRNA synthetase